MWTVLLRPAERKVRGRTVSYLLTWSGDDGIELVSTWNLSATDKKKLSAYWTHFENYLSSKGHFRLARYKLRTRRQEPDKAVDAFVKKIRILVEECRFTKQDEHIIDALIFGSNSKRSQTKFLEKHATLTLDTALDIARTKDVTSKQDKGISSDLSTRVDALKHGRASSKSGNFLNKPRSPTVRVCGCCGTELDISQRSLYAQLIDQFVMHVVKSIIREKSVGHQSLAKGINVQVVVAKGILRHLRKNHVQRSIFMALKLMMKLKTALVYHFPISCIFIPYQPGHERWHSSFRGGSGVWSVHEITLVQSWHRRWGERYFIKYLLFPESPYNDNVTPTNL